MNAPAPGTPLDPALVDHGGGRRLDRLGGILVDRPCAAALGAPADPAAWAQATVRHVTPSGAAPSGSPEASPSGFSGAAALGAGLPRVTPSRVPPPRATPSGPGAEWAISGGVPEPWSVVLPIGPATITLAVRPAPSGQIGLFLEQLPQWRWLAQRVGMGQRVLSLFSHSGAASLAAAAAGAAVVSVDASRPATALARGNAALSGLADRPIAWIEDDARKVVGRLGRRGERFDAVVLDPPSWGHGTRGEAFAIDRDLEPLLDDVARLLSADGPGTFLVTCHSPRWPADRLRHVVEGTLARAGRPGARIEADSLVLDAESGRRLALGVFARAGGAAHSR